MCLQLDVFYFVGKASLENLVPMKMIDEGKRIWEALGKERNEK